MIACAARFAVPGVRLAVGAAALRTDHCTQIGLLYLPQAAQGRLGSTSNARRTHNPESTAPFRPTQAKKYPKP